MYRIVTEMYRTAGAAHRVAMLLPALVLAAIAAGSAYGLIDRRYCGAIYTVQAWTLAMTNVFSFVLFRAWQWREYHRVAFRLVDEGRLSVERPDPSDRAVVFDLGNGRRSASAPMSPAWRRFIVALSLVFPFIVPLSASSADSDRCAVIKNTAKLLAQIPMEIVILFMSAFLLAIAWLFLWAGEGYAIADRLVARTQERNSRHGLASV